MTLQNGFNHVKYREIKCDTKSVSWSAKPVQLSMGTRSGGTSHRLETAMMSEGLRLWLLDADRETALSGGVLSGPLLVVFPFMNVCRRLESGSKGDSDDSDSFTRVTSASASRRSTEVGSSPRPRASRTWSLFWMKVSISSTSAPCRINDCNCSNSSESDSPIVNSNWFHRSCWCFKSLAVRLAATRRLWSVASSNTQSPPNLRHRWQGAGRPLHYTGQRVSID